MPTDPSAGAAAPAGGAALLEVRRLSVEFRASGRSLHAVREVSFRLDAGETLGVLGESGSGKSVTALAVMDLLDPLRATVRGKVLLRGTDLRTAGAAARNDARGRQVAMIFQDALAALNPVQCVGSQVAEVLRVRLGRSRAEARHGAVELLGRVGIPAAARRYGSFPHELSGGMRQRVMIAMALAGAPELLLADEPTTSLDVTVQAQIVDLLRALRDEQQMALVFITHDIG
ncbi:MAG TPA: ABC transporter ATP-binding protein, partial [Acidimicrobiales bacterium]|nr:ABC transporter ATP-binding protein [Acidimicrobiales bacterium]